MTSGSKGSDREAWRENNSSASSTRPDSRAAVYGGPGHRSEARRRPLCLLLVTRRLEASDDIDPVRDHTRRPGLNSPTDYLQVTTEKKRVCKFRRFGTKFVVVVVVVFGGRGVAQNDP